MNERDRDKNVSKRKEENKKERKEIMKDKDANTRRR